MKNFYYPEVGFTVKAGEPFKTDPDGVEQTLPFDFVVASDSGILVEQVTQPWETIGGTESNPAHGILNGVLGEYFVNGERVMQRYVSGEVTEHFLVCYIGHVRSFKAVQTNDENQTVISSDLTDELANYFSTKDSEIADMVREELGL